MKFKTKEGFIKYDIPDGLLSNLAETGEYNTPIKGRNNFIPQHKGSDRVMSDIEHYEYLCKTIGVEKADQHFNELLDIK